MSDKYICSGNTFTYSNGYIGLPLRLNELPQSIEINDTTLHRKDEFHVSLLCVKNVLKVLPDVENQIVESFCNFVQENDISFIRFTGELRLAEKEDRKTIVALCEIKNLKEFFNQLSSELDFDIAHQPTHVTLYTLQPNKGIGLNSPEDLAFLSKEVEAPEEVKSHLSLM